MLALGFLHPALLWALPLAAVPIVIHLLNRRRFDKVRWAAMEYLLAALKRNRRRIRMEQWLVLLLRVAAVALLALLVARPQVSGSVLGEVRTHHVICLDDSASMAHRRGAGDAFQAARERIAQLCADFAETRPGDLLTILRASRPQTPVLFGERIGARTRGAVRDALAELRVSDDVADLGALLGQAAARIEAATEASRAEVSLVTDLREVDWLDDEGKPRPLLLRELMALDPERVRLTVISVAPGDTDNLAVVQVRREGRSAIAGVPQQLVVEVKNLGPTASAPTEVALEVDGKSRVLRPLEALESGEAREVTFPHTFEAPGFHGVTASIPLDRYAVDDARALALEVAASSRVLLVDGDPGDRPEEAETYALAAALEHRQSGIAVEVIPDHVLGDYDLAEVDMVFLCNVPAPDAATVQALERFVRGGGGLAVFLGDQVDDPKRYNEALFRDGQGLLPVELVDLAGDFDRPDHVFLADESHATMRTATDDLEVVFAKLVLVGRYFRVAERPAIPVKVPLRVRDATGDPLLVTRTFEDGGEVMLVTTTADSSWSNWPRWPTFLIVTQEMHAIAAKRRDDAASNLGPRGALHLPLDAARFRPDVVVRQLAPDSVEQTFTARVVGEADAATLESSVEISMGELRGRGLFELLMTPHSGERERRLFSRNAPVVEGRLAMLTRRALFRAYPEELQDRLTLVEDEADRTAVQSGRGDAWRTLAMAMLGVLLLESFLAWRFGRR